MNHKIVSGLSIYVLCCLSRTLCAQSSPTVGLGSEFVNRSITAIGYQVGSGTTSLDLKSTGLLAKARGQARVEAKPTVTTVQADVQGFTAPTPLGAEFLTYVLWAVSPE